MNKAYCFSKEYSLYYKLIVSGEGNSYMSCKEATFWMVSLNSHENKFKCSDSESDGVVGRLYQLKKAERSKESATTPSYF